MGRIHSISDAAHLVRELADRGKLEEALQILHDVVDRIISEPLCTAQVFGSQDLDKLCLHIGRKSHQLLMSDSRLNPLQPSSENSVIIYIVSKLQRSGGHARVIRDIILAEPSYHHLILASGVAGPSDRDYVESLLTLAPSISYEHSLHLKYTSRLRWLQERLLAVNPKKVYLFNHHQDSISAAAVIPEMNLDCYFYHHGDHHLCLGVYHEHLKHIDPHSMGYFNCRDRLGIENLYLPLTANDYGCSTSRTFRNDGHLVTCTAARSNKIEPAYIYSYMDFVPTLLAHAGGTHIHIGKLSPWALRKINTGLKRQGISLSRFVYIEWVPSIWKFVQEHNVDLFISSFPYAAGLTLIEAMGAGVPVAIHNHLFSRFLSGIDTCYPEAYGWRRPQELLEYCKNVTSHDLALASINARLHYERYHRPEDFEAAIKNGLSSSQKPTPLRLDYSMQMDEWALWMESRVTIKNVIRRFLFRLVKRLSSQLPMKLLR